MRVLITGAAGQVGKALLASVPAGAIAQAMTREQLDIADAAAVRVAVTAFRPDIIINAAAYTAVDAAESEPERAAAINVEGPRNLAQSAHNIDNCRLLHISTDYVFDGSSVAPYQTGDPPNPLNVYGRTKLAGERAVLEVLGNRAVVLRTAWVYSANGKNFLLTMLGRMRTGDPVRVVADQTGTPTAASSVARALWCAAVQPRICGVLHWTDAGITTWFGFAQAIAQEAAAAGLLTAANPEVIPITTADYLTRARRPARSVLEIANSAAQLGIHAMHWRSNVRATLGTVLALRRADRRDS